MRKLGKQSIIAFFMTMLICLSCKPNPKVNIAPFVGLADLTYEDLVEAGFYNIKVAEEQALTRLEGNRQLIVELDQKDCLPNMMNDGLTCSSYQLKHTVFSQYFPTYDSLAIIQLVEQFGGKVIGKWRVDLSDVNGLFLEKDRSIRYLPIQANEKRFTGVVFIHESGETTVTIAEEKGNEAKVLSCRKPSTVYQLRLMARELLKKEL